jgi:hypothetical protein
MQHQTSPEMQACMDACHDCHMTCLSMAMNHCLEVGGRHVEPQHMRIMLDCAQICSVALDFMAGSSEHHRHICRECAEICRACAGAAGKSATWTNASKPASGYYDQRITQRLILQPRAELNFAAQDVPENGSGSGLSDAELGLRLRYEIRREIAPYVGVSWERSFGDTRRFARAEGEDTGGFSFVAGIRTWF